MRYLILSILISVSTLGFSQNQLTPQAKTNSVSYEKFVIGIGNSDENFYTNVLHYLENDNAIVVYAICESHKIIGFKVNISLHKDYDTVRDLLLNEFEDLKLFRKEETIFTNDCSDEIKKQ